MLVLLFCKLSEQYSQTIVPIKPFNVTRKKQKTEMADIYISIIIIIICYIYIVLFWVLKALYIEVGESPQPAPMCSIYLDVATAAILRQNAHHTP